MCLLNNNKSKHSKKNKGGYAGGGGRQTDRFYVEIFFQHPFPTTTIVFSFEFYSFFWNSLYEPKDLNRKRKRETKNGNFIQLI